MLAGIAVLTVSFLPWRFQLNDDMIMMWLVRGDYSGQPESYAVFIHPILSWTFAELYTLIPGVNWYPLTWFLVMYSSFLVFVNGIHTHLPKYLATFLSLLLLAFFIHFFPPKNGGVHPPKHRSSTNEAAAERNQKSIKNEML